MAGWGKLVAGAVLGVAGTLYATNEELRRRLPDQLQDLPVEVRERFRRAVEVGREAASRKRAEISEEVSRHGGEASRVRKSSAGAVNVPQRPEDFPDTPGGRSNASPTDDPNRNPAGDSSVSQRIERVDG